jgi:hypothetical protein
MPAKTLGYSTTLTVISCGECAIPFAIPSNLDNAAQKDGRSFWCPNGHKISYSETENQRLARELTAAKKRQGWAEANATAARDQAEAAERSARAYKGHATRIRNRFGAGMCPVDGCRRHFNNLADHMTTEHPGYRETDL